MSARAAILAAVAVAFAVGIPLGVLIAVPEEAVPAVEQHDTPLTFADLVRAGTEPAEGERVYGPGNPWGALPGVVYRVSTDVDPADPMVPAIAPQK